MSLHEAQFAYSALQLGEQHATPCRLTYVDPNQQINNVTASKHAELQDRREHPETGGLLHVRETTLVIPRGRALGGLDEVRQDAHFVIDNEKWGIARIDSSDIEFFQVAVEHVSYMEFTGVRGRRPLT